MKHFYIIANLDKEYVQEAQVFIKAYLEAKGAECLLHHTPERTRGAAHIDGAQVPEDTECVITIGGDGTLIQAARDLAGRNIPMLGVNRGHLGYLNQVSRQEDIAPVLESLLNERYQLERRMTLSLTQNLIILCGHFKGIDYRIREHLITKEISIGDYVLTGGELAAAVMADAIVRIIPGVISDEQSALSDSFQDNLLAAPVYTRPADYNGWKVPEILLSGHEAKIKEWELQQSLERTRRLRPDLLGEE